MPKSKTRKEQEVFMNGVFDKLDEAKEMIGAFIDARIDARLEPLFKAIGADMPKRGKAKR